MLNRLGCAEMFAEPSRPPCREAHYTRLLKPHNCWHGTTTDTAQTDILVSSKPALQQRDTSHTPLQGVCSSAARQCQVTRRSTTVYQTVTPPHADAFVL